MSDDPNSAGYQTIKDIQDKQERDKQYGVSLPGHSGPNFGANDLMVYGILLGSFWGLLVSGGGILEGLIGAFVGAGVGLALKFVLSLPFRLLGFIINAFRPKPEAQPPAQRRKTAADSIDWEAKRRAKYGKKK